MRAAYGATSCTVVPTKLWVEVLEDGSAALAWTDPKKVKSMATTPRGLRRVLDQLCKGQNK
jgi:hypothetical protein